MTLQIALVAAIVLLAVCLLACCVAHRQSRRSQQQFKTQSRQVGQALDQAARNYHQIERAARQYPTGDPDPYGPVAKELDGQRGQIRAAYRQCRTWCRQLAAQTHPATTSLLHQTWALLSSEVFRWRQQLHEIGSLAESVRALTGQVGRAQASLERLRTLPLVAARRARDLHRQIAQITAHVQALQQAGVHGPTIEQAAVQAAELQDSLAQLPGWCALEDDDQVLEQAPRASTIQAWQLLDELEGPARHWQTTFQRWQTLHQEIGEGLQALQRALGQARAHLVRVPGSIDVEDRALQLSELEAMPAKMQVRYQAPTVQELEALHPEISPIIKTAGELGALFESIAHEYEHLRHALDGLAQLMHETQDEMDALAQAAEYPIDWEAHRHTPVRLGHRKQVIGALAYRRTPEQLAGHAALADDLIDQGRALSRAVDSARNTRMILVHMLARPELIADPSWLGIARRLHAQVSKHGPENWPEGLAAASILSDAQELEQRRRQCVPASPRTALRVTQLDARLHELQTLADELAAFRRRLDRIDDRLAALQNARQTALQDVQRADQAVGRLISLLQSATPAIGRWTPLHGHQRQLEKTLRSGRGLVDELGHPRTARIEAQIARKDRWMRASEKALRGLHVALYASRKNQENELRNAVSELQSVAPFDQEKAMQEAREQLDDERPEVPEAADRDGTASQIAALVGDTAKTLQDRERLYRVLDRLTSQIKTRIEGSLEASTQARQQARSGYEALVELKGKSEQIWPPLQCDTKLAETLLASVERDEQALRSSGRTVQEVTHYLDRIGQGYKSLNDEAQSKIGQNGWQRQEVQALWDRLGRWQASLANYGRAHQHEQSLASAAHRWSQETAREIGSLQRSHGRSPMTHEQAKRMLEDLWARVHDREMPVRGQGAPLQAGDIESEFPV